jgi:hypothetical protein
MLLMSLPVFVPAEITIFDQIHIIMWAESNLREGRNWKPQQTIQDTFNFWFFVIFLESPNYAN